MLPRPNACEERGSLGSGVWRGLPGQAEGGWPTVGKGGGVWMRRAGPGRGRGSLQRQRPCFGAPTNQTDPGLPTESSLRLGPPFPAPPPQLWASLMAQIVKNPPARQETWIPLLGPKIPCRRKLQPTPLFSPRKSSGQRILAGHRVSKSRSLVRD